MCVKKKKKKIIEGINDLKIKVENWASYRMAQPDSRSILKRAELSACFTTTTRLSPPV